MLSIPIELHGFKPVEQHHLAKATSLPCKWADIIWAALTVGRASSAEVLKHGPHSCLEILYRFFMLHANLQQTAGPEAMVESSPAFRDLEASEKGAISYFLGLTMAKLVAERVLGVPWLMHLRSYQDQLMPHLATSQHPDLVGFDLARRCFVVEAKGRSHQPCRSAKRDLLAAARRQLASLRTVRDPDTRRSHRPHLRAATVAFFAPTRLQLVLQAYRPAGKAGAELALSADALVRDYYRPVVDLIINPDANRHISRESWPPDRQFAMVELPAVDSRVGLDTVVLDILLQTTPDVRELLSAIAAALPRPRPALIDPDAGPGAETQPDPEQDVSVGADGVIVQLGPAWSAEQMTLPPEKRLLS